MKAFQKIICAIVSLSVVAATMTCMATSSSAVANTPGDVNSDGSVTLLMRFRSLDTARVPIHSPRKKSLPQMLTLTARLHQPTLSIFSSSRQELLTDFRLRQMRDEFIFSAISTMTKQPAR